MSVRKIAVGKDLYVFTSKVNMNDEGWRGNPNCIIDCHGFRPPTKPYFELRRGQTVHFYVNRHAALNITEVQSFGHHYVDSVDAIAYQTEPPAETIKGPARCPDYLLGKQVAAQQGPNLMRYDDVGYDDLLRYLEMRHQIAAAYDFVSIRNRAGRSVTLSSALASLRKRAYGYAIIHCSFCRGGVLDVIKDFFGTGLDETVGGHPA